MLAMDHRSWCWRHREFWLPAQLLFQERRSSPPLQTSQNVLYLVYSCVICMLLCDTWTILLVCPILFMGYCAREGVSITKGSFQRDFETLLPLLQSVTPSDVADDHKVDNETCFSVLFPCFLCWLSFQPLYHEHVGTHVYISLSRSVATIQSFTSFCPSCLILACMYKTLYFWVIFCQVTMSQ